MFDAWISFEIHAKHQITSCHVDADIFLRFLDYLKQLNESIATGRSIALRNCDFLDGVTFESWASNYLDLVHACLTLSITMSYQLLTDPFRTMRSLYFSVNRCATTETTEV